MLLPQDIINVIIVNGDYIIWRLVSKVCKSYCESLEYIVTDNEIKYGTLIGHIGNNEITVCRNEVIICGLRYYEQHDCVNYFTKLQIKYNIRFWRYQGKYYNECLVCHCRWKGSWENHGNYIPVDEFDIHYKYSQNTENSCIYIAKLLQDSSPRWYHAGDFICTPFHDAKHSPLSILFNSSSHTKSM